MDLAVHHHLKHRCRRRNRQAASRLRFHMRQVKMRRVIGAGGFHIEAIPLPFPIRRGRADAAGAY